MCTKLLLFVKSVVQISGEKASIAEQTAFLIAILGTYLVSLKIENPENSVK